MSESKGLGDEGGTGTGLEGGEGVGFAVTGEEERLGAVERESERRAGIRCCSGSGTD